MGLSEAHLNRLVELIVSFIKVSNQNNGLIQDVQVENDLSGKITITVKETPMDRKEYSKTKIVIPQQELKENLPSRRISRSTQTEQKDDKIDIAIQLALSIWKIEMINDLGDVSWQSTM